MIRDLGTYVPRRPRRLNAPLLGMLLNGVHDHHAGRVFALQVGAGTGETSLPLLSRFQKDGWSGLLIEPLPHNFARLEALHLESDRVAVLNLGISDQSATLALHALTPEAEARNRRLAPGRASLTRDRIATDGIAEADIITAEVPFLRMDTVLQELGIDSVQLVAINAGGHEAQVLRSFDLAKLDPPLVLVHSSAGTAADDACVAVMTGANLLTFRLGGWLVGLAPARLAVPLEELLTFLQKALTAPQDEDE
ncbi:MAG TPA: FkbM family methyltransferase [Tabrizicola sp.]